MATSKNPDEYFEKDSQWKATLDELRSIIRKTELSECIKWGAPAYTLNNKNVLGLMGFKNHVSLWFHNGVFLEDKDKKLLNAQEGKTKAMRQWRFTSHEQVLNDRELIASYLNEAIQNQKDGKEIKPDKSTTIKKNNKSLLIDNLMIKDLEFKNKFNSFSAACQREFHEYISEAKRDETKVRRLEKIKPMVLRGEKLNDRYSSKK